MGDALIHLANSNIISTHGKSFFVTLFTFELSIIMILNIDYVKAYLKTGNCDWQEDNPAKPNDNYVPGMTLRVRGRKEQGPVSRPRATGSTTMWVAISENAAE